MEQVIKTSTQATPATPAVGVANASFGEVLQGVLPGSGRHFLVTLPVDLYSRATVRLEREPHISIEPAHKTKSLTFARRLCEELGYRGGASIEIESDMEEGKGLSSSTADIVAVARGFAGALRTEVTPEQVCRGIRGIEPTDGLMYEGCVSFYHREIELRKRLGRLPRLALLGVDEGGIVDTLEYNQRNSTRTADEMAEYESLLIELEGAISRGEMETIGRIATRSALMNQRYNHKRSLPALMHLGERHGALGVVVGHSGTVAALLMHAEGPDFARRYEECLADVRRLPGRTITCNSI